MGRILARLGEDAAYTPSGGGSTTTVRGMFERPYQLAAGMVESSDPAFKCLAADVASVKHGDQLVIRGGTYKVCGVQPDPVSGLTALQLQLQP